MASQSPSQILESGQGQPAVGSGCGRKYSVLQVARYGYAKAELATNDSDVSEVRSQYIVNSVTAKALRQRGDRTGSGRDAAYEQADRYEQLAQVDRQRGGVLANIRWLQDG